MKQEDQEFELRKQRSIVRQNALAHATNVVMGLGASGLDKFTLQNCVQRIKEAAEEFVEWVYESNESTTDLPLPTVEQNKWLGKIEEKYGFNKETIYRACNRYPSTQQEAKEVIKKCQNLK